MTALAKLRELASRRSGGLTLDAYHHPYSLAQQQGGE
jgi:hypothetical protein